MNGVLEDLLRHQQARQVLRDQESTTAQRDAARAVLGLPQTVCGTRSRYVNCRCRCDLCREANNVYMESYRGRRRRGLLAVLCWCESEIVHVPDRDVRGGRTGTCGRPGCQP